MPIELYLDTCIFLRIYDKKDKLSKKICSVIESLNKSNEITFCLSDFVFTEAIKVIDETNLTRDNIITIINKIIRINKMEKYSIKILEGEGNKKYNLAEFFTDIQEIIINTKPHASIADAIHSVIMVNNKVKYILTLDIEDWGEISKVEGKGIIPLELNNAEKVLLEKPKSRKVFIPSKSHIIKINGNSSILKKN
jgi:predicted nucleic acid-binding protein